jgi:WD40 repeat protein
LTQSYDVFLSYARVDAAASQELDAWLRQQGVRTFFDQRDLRPGLRWVVAIEEAIGSSGSIAILIGPHGLGNTQQYEREAALVRQGRERGFLVIPVLLPGVEVPPTGFLELQTWVDLRSPGGLLQQVQGLHSLLAAIRGQPVDSAEVRASVCPYRGMEPFREEDAAFFCGRDAAVRDLVETVRQHSFVAVVGRSGSGKSSLVYAGLMPALRQQRATVAWDVVSLRPGMRPLHALAAAFNEPPAGAGTFSTQDWLDREATALRTGTPDKLAAAIAARLDDASECPDRLLLYIDQWEELYAMAPGELASEVHRQHAIDVDRFIALLLAATDDPRARTSVVLTIRADFYGPLIRHPVVSTKLPTQQLNIGPLTTDDIRAAITVPARKVGLVFDPPALVEQIQDDVGTDEGRLPLLQYALKETWNNRNGTRLTAEAYASSGRVSGAIQKSAERTFAALTAPEQEAARRLFLGLVTPGEGREDTRARIAMPTDKALLAVLNKFASPGARLLVTGSEQVTPGAGSGNASVRPTVEVAHEALIRSWGTLRGWLEVNRENLRARAAVLQRQRQWEENGQRDDLLLQSGFELERGRLLLDNPGDVPVDDIKDFVDRSIRHESARLAAEREKELAVERREKEQAEQAAAKIRGWFLTASAAALVAGLAMLATGWQWIRAAEALVEAQRKESLALAFQSQLETDRGSAAKGMDLALRGLPTRFDTRQWTNRYRRGPDRPAVAETVGALVRAWAARRDLGSWGHGAAPRRGAMGQGVGVTPTLVLIADGPGVRFVNAADGTDAGSLQRSDSENAYGLVADAKTRRAVTTRSYMGLDFWDIETKRPIKSLQVQSKLPLRLALDPNKSILAAGSEDYNVYLVDIENMKILNAFGAGGSVLATAFSHDGSMLASALENGKISLWLTANWQTDSGFVHRSPVWTAVREGYVKPISMAFSADGSKLAVAYMQGILVWSVPAFRAQTNDAKPELALSSKQITELGGEANAVAFVPSGQLLAAGYADGSIRMLDLTGDGSTERLAAAPQSINSLAFVDDERLVSLDSTGAAQAWAVTRNRLWVKLSDANELEYSLDCVTFARHVPNLLVLRHRSEAFLSDTETLIVELKPDGTPRIKRRDRKSFMDTAPNHNCAELAASNELVTISGTAHIDGTVQASRPQPGSFRRPDTLDGLAKGVAPVVTKDGKAIMDVTANGNVEIWDDEGRLLAVWGVPDGAVQVELSADDRTILVRTTKGEVYFWPFPIPLERFVTEARSRASALPSSH